MFQKENVRAGIPFSGQRHDLEVVPADFFPVLDLAGINIGELLAGQFADRVGRINYQGNAVVGDMDLLRFDAVLLGLLDLLRLHVAGSLGDIGRPADQRRDTGPRAAAGDRDRDGRVSLHKIFRPGLAQIDHRVGTLDLHGLLAAAATIQDSRDQARANAPNNFFVNILTSRRINIGTVYYCP